MFSKKNTLALVNELKSGNEDFEFYPTTQEMIDVVSNDIKSILQTHDFYCKATGFRILDIGAGDARVLLSLKEQLKDSLFDNAKIQLLAIEKAVIHINGYRSKDVTLIGTEFNEINLISKNAEVVFQNPPYKHFSFWLSSVISQLNFGVLYAVIPSRWKDDAAIQQAITNRKIVDTTVLASMNFENADRAARAKVDIVRFSFNSFQEEVKDLEVKINAHPELKLRNRSRIRIGINKNDSFQFFIDNELGLKKDRSNTVRQFDAIREAERIKHQMKENGCESFSVVKRQDVIPTLIKSYEDDIAHVLSQYKKIGELDASILDELGVSHSALVKGIKEKLLGFRNIYWALLFDYLDVITQRLTSNYKTKLLNALKANALDFTAKNSAYIINYAVEMANELIEDSIIDVFKEMTCEKSISRFYVSNQHYYQDKWRYNSTLENVKRNGKYMLDYRFIISGITNFGTQSWEHGLNSDARDFTNNLMVVLTLLGYGNVTPSECYDSLSSGSFLIIKGNDINGNELDLIKIRFYLNGNRHLNFNQEAMLRLNVVASRLMGWVRNKAEFEQETEIEVPLSEWSVADTMKLKSSDVLMLNNNTN